jgi:hypothetical protein
MCAAARGPRAWRVRQYCLDTPCRIPLRCGTVYRYRFIKILSCVHAWIIARARYCRARVIIIFRMHFIDERTMHDHRWSNSVVSVSGMRVGEACWITNIGRIDDFRTSMDSGRTPLWRVGVISQTSTPGFYYLTSTSEGFVPEKRYIRCKTQYGCGIDGKLRISRFQRRVDHPPFPRSHAMPIVLADGSPADSSGTRSADPPEVIWANYIVNP